MGGFKVVAYLNLSSSHYNEQYIELPGIWQLIADIWSMLIKT